jgi:hypothetical protein
MTLLLLIVADLLVVLLIFVVAAWIQRAEQAERSEHPDPRAHVRRVRRPFDWQREEADDAG